MAEQNMEDDGVHLGSFIRRVELHLVAEGKGQLRALVTEELERLFSGAKGYAPLEDYTKLAREYGGAERTLQELTEVGREIRTYGARAEKYFPNPQPRQLKVYGTD